MSTLQVEGIRNAAATSDAISLATDGTCTTKATNKVVHNLLYNGEMQIAQRATSSTSYGYQTVDRWKVNVSVGAFTTSQDTESPNNFAKSLKLDCTTAATASANNNISIQQHLEGFDLQGIGAGTSGAKSLTLSFWVRSTKTGVFNTILYQKDGGKFAVQNTTISSANTWEKKTFTVAGNTADAIANDNSKSLTVEFWLDAGPDYRGGTVDGSWNTWANNEAGEGITLNLGDNTANNFWITGIQLEMGDIASDYCYRSYGEELHRCQRYFQSTYEPGSTDAYRRHGIGFSPNTSRCDTVYWFNPRLRTTPSGSSSGNFKMDGHTTRVVTSITYQHPTTSSVTIVFNDSGSGMNADTNWICRADNDADARIDFNAEL